MVYLWPSRAETIDFENEAERVIDTYFYSLQHGFRTGANIKD